MKKINFIILLAIILLQIRCESFKQKVVKKEVIPESEKEETTLNEKISNELSYYIGNKIYRNNWKMWSGKKAFYKGKENEHHSTLSTTYVNDIAYDIIKNKKGLMPRGNDYQRKLYIE